MNFESKAEIQEAISRLREFFASQPDGAVLTWVDIEVATGVKQRTNREREWTRRALRKDRRPFSAIIGTGVELSRSDTALRISSQHVRKAGKAIKRAAKNVNVLCDRHLDEAPLEDRPGLVAQRAMLGALSATHKQPKRMARPQAAPLPPPALPLRRVGS